MKSSTNRALVAKKQSTFSAVMANNLLNVLQGYTKGIRLLLVMFLTLTVGAEVWGAIDANSTWTKTAWTSIKDGATFIIANNCDIAMYNGNGTSAPSQISIDYDTNTKKITVNTSGKSHEDIAWIFSGSSSAATIKSYKNQSNNLYTTSANNGLKVGNTQCTYSMGSMGRLLKASTYARYVGTYSTTEWRSYTTENADNYGSSCSDQTLTFYVLDEAVSCSSQVTITKASATGGSFKVHQETASGTEISSDDKIDNCDANAVVVVVPTADANYTCTGVTATNSNSIEPNGDGNYTITYTKDSNISSTITVSFTENQKYTVTWKVNGIDYTVGGPTTQVYDGGKVTKLPTAPDPANNCGEVFAGWTTTPIDGTTNDKPSVLFTTAANSPAIDKNTTFYAVFADYEQ